MNQRIALGLTLLAGIAIGATAIQGLHAQAKPKAYLVTELQVLDPIGRPEKSKAIQYAVAGPVVQAIDDVCAAPPGILVPPSFAAFRAS